MFILFHELFDFSVHIFIVERSIFFLDGLSVILVLSSMMDD